MLSWFSFLSVDLLAADIMLWRDKNVSASILAGLTIIWFLFEGLGYNLLNLICHSLILLLAVLFLWINLGPTVPKLWWVCSQNQS